MPKSSSPAKRLLQIMQKQESLLNELKLLAPQESGEGKSEDGDNLAEIWAYTLETLETAVEAVEDLAWSVDPSCMCEATARQ
jgi:hypothetical protein